MQSSSTPLITKDDIRKIQNYTSAAKALPRTIEDVEKQLKTKHTGIVGLEPFDIVTLNHTLINNANSWNDIEYSMKRVAGSLATFSEDLESFGQDIIDAIVTMPGYINYLGTLDALTEEEINALPPLEIGKTEKNRFGSIQEALVFIASSIEEKKLSSLDVAARLQYFKAELSGKVSISLGEKLKLAGDEDINRQITELNDAIDKAQKAVEQKTRETKPNFFENILGFIAGRQNPYGTDLYYKYLEIEQAKVLRPLIAQRDLLAEQVKQKNILAGTLLEFQAGLDSISIYVEGAIQSTSQLETLWINISDYINASQNKIKGMHDFLSLRSFVSSLRITLKNWKTVEHNSHQLINAFD
ncbi:alpha-xenorhabdolysin family binary toxin subunit A [Pseudomonas sp. Eth.TT006]